MPPTSAARPPITLYSDTPAAVMVPPKTLQFSIRLVASSEPPMPAADIFLVPAAVILVFIIFTLVMALFP